MSSSITRLLSILALGACISTTAQAQATRTWVSGTGDDANPCSRTAPCKTFAGAISKTAAGGEINVIDPGGFGAVTITKAITIDGGGMESGVLTNAANAINVNAGANDHVVLRGLDIEGLGTSTAAIRFNSGGSLMVERCVIDAFTGNGIDAIPTTPNARLSVSDCTIVKSAIGIYLRPGAGGSVIGSIRNTRVFQCTTGIRAEGAAFASVEGCSFTSNVANGIVGFTGGVVNASRSVCSHNGGGVYASGGIVRLTDMVITDNSAHGLLPATANSILSFGDNKVAGNNPDNAPSAVLPLR